MTTINYGEKMNQHEQVTEYYPGTIVEINVLSFFGETPAEIEQA